MMRQRVVVGAGAVVVVLLVVFAVVGRSADPGPAAHLPPVRPGPRAAAPEPAAQWAVPEPPPVAASPPVLEPGMIEIPSIGVAARLESSRVVHGEFAVPGPSRVGVHRSGTADELDARLAPGEGTLLAAGHVTWNDELGALYELHRIEPGALIHTSDLRGRTETWQATELRLVPYDALPTDLLDATGPRRLVLVTCAGEVVTDAAGERTFSDNLVVTAAPVKVS